MKTKEKEKMKTKEQVDFYLSELLRQHKDEVVRAAHKIIKGSESISLFGFITNAVVLQCKKLGLSFEETCQLVDVMKERITIKE